VGGRSTHRHVAVRPVLALGAAALFAAIAIAVIVGLTLHAKSTREHDDTIDELVSQINDLQGVPWRFQTTGEATSGATAARALRVSMLDGEQHILQSLGHLRSEALVPGLREAARPLAANFAALNTTVEFVARRRYAAAGLLAPVTFQTHDAAIAALDRAFSHYRSQTSTAELEAVLGTVAAVLLLLGGFTLFYLRAYREKASSEQLADELRHSQAHLEVAQHLAGVGSWEWDPDTELLTLSAEHARLHDWTSPDPPRDAAAIIDLVAPDDRDRVREALAAAARSSVPIDFDYRVREANGGRLIHVTAVTVAGADGRRRMVGTSQDVTERFKRAEAERANRAKDEFISRMSHELRTPLNAVLGFGQLLTMSDLDERQHANVEHILSAGRHLLELINEILDISRIESGELRLSLEPVSTRGMIDDAIDLVMPAADPRGIEVTARLPSEDVWVRADVQRLRQVLLNLLSNAVKYNREGGHVEVRAALSGSERAEITVQDDGPGIAPELVDRLFSPFERLGAEQSSVEGTGLGLAVSRGMIEAMGGRISVRSERGRGSAFTIELEIERAPQLGIAQMGSAA
jgi:signal transduction histidine kinase